MTKIILKIGAPPKSTNVSSGPRNSKNLCPKTQKYRKVNTNTHRNAAENPHKHRNNSKGKANERYYSGSNSVKFHPNESKFYKGEYNTPPPVTRQET